MLAHFDRNKARNKTKTRKSRKIAPLIIATHLEQPYIAGRLFATFVVFVLFHLEYLVEIPYQSMIARTSARVRANLQALRRIGLDVCFRIVD